jgi:hypothetical protein
MTPDELLGPTLGGEVAWQASDNPIPDSDMARVFAGQSQTHKVAHYIPIYEDIFGAYRDRPIQMLEIGVDRGGSLQLWRKYFRPESVIVGIDCLQQCKRFDDPANNVHVRIGYQEDAGFLQTVVTEFGGFDIILDDGSHYPSHVLASFGYLFPNGLVDHGVYLVEDLFCSYVPDMEPGHPPFMDTVKALIDVMHAHYPMVSSGPGPDIAYAFEVNKLDLSGPNLKRRQQLQVPLATVLISSIQVHDSIVAIFRGPRELPRILRK